MAVAMVLTRNAARAMPKPYFMVTTVEGEDTSKVLIQINIGSEGYGIEQHYGDMCRCMWREWKEKRLIKRVSGY